MSTQEHDALAFDAAALKELQDRLLAAQVALCYTAHPFYSRLMRHLDLDPADVTSTQDLAKLPVTTKQDFLRDPDAFRLDPEAASLPPLESNIWDIIYTTGTSTGAPAPVYSSSFDYLTYLRTAARRSDHIDLREGDVVVNLFPLTPFPTGASLRLPAEAAACGASVIAALPGRGAGDGSPVPRSLDAVVELVARHRATVLVGVAGFVRRLLLRCAELGVTLPDLRTCTLTGEASSVAFREDVRARMRAVGAAATGIVNRYGSTEQGTSMVECQEGSGFHDLSPDQVYLEVVGAADDARLPDGDRGRLVFTHLIRRGTVFLRYAVGDIGALSRAPCPTCHLTSPRLVSDPVRTREIVKVKGTLVNLDALQASLDGRQDLDEYQVVIGKEPGDPLGMDTLSVRLAPSSSATADVAADVATLVRELIHVSPEIEVVSPDSIYDPLTMPKPTRVVDSRPASTDEVR